MAIITENINNIPMGQAVLSISQEAPFVKLPEELTSIDFCTCDYECEYFNFLFASLDSDEDFKNDKTSYLYGVSDSSGTLEITLVGPNDETVISDNSLGEYFPQGSFTNTENQVNYVGFIADWKKILTNKGAGTFYFKFKETVFGEDFETETVKYKLLPYNETLIHKTLRFKFIQNGFIENGLDYTGLNWNTQVRIQGSILKTAPILEKETYLNTNRKKRAIQLKSIKTFDFETGLIPYSIGKLIEEGALSDDVLVTNYDWFAFERLQDFNVDITEIDIRTNFKNNSLGAYTCSVEERIQNSVKRNI